MTENELTELDYQLRQWTHNHLHVLDNGDLLLSSCISSKYALQMLEEGCEYSITQEEYWEDNNDWYSDINACLDGFNPKNHNQKFIDNYYQNLNETISWLGCYGIYLVFNKKENIVEYKEGKD